jgi:hypothetical protein
MSGAEPADDYKLMCGRWNANHYLKQNILAQYRITSTVKRVGSVSDRMSKRLLL